MSHTEMDGTPQRATASAMRTPPLSDSPVLAARAIHFLCESKSSFTFETEDAQRVVPYLRWVSYSAGSYLYREGDDTKTGYMLLLLDGDVSVDTSASGRADRVAISVLGPGSLIGEMALVDGAPRSASCIAVTNVQAAGMSHAGLERMAREYPDVAFKFMIYMARNTVDRLRALSEQLHLYDQVIASLHQEIDQLRLPGTHRKT